MKLKSAAQRGLKNGKETYLLLAKVILPFYVLIPILRVTPLFSLIEDMGRPLVMFMGLPGEAALVLVTGYFFNFYSAIALMNALSFTTHEITVIGTMLVIAHSLLVEGAVLKQFDLQYSFMMLFRLVLSLLAGTLVAHIIL